MKIQAIALSALILLSPAGWGQEDEVESVYRWQGVIEYACERQLIVKTTRARVQTLRDHLKTLHPYKTPEFLVLPVADGGDDYLEWIRGAVGERNSGESRHKG